MDRGCIGKTMLNNISGYQVVFTDGICSPFRFDIELTVAYNSVFGRLLQTPPGGQVQPFAES